MYLVTSLQKFACFLERRLGRFPAMGHLAAIVTIGLDRESSFFLLALLFQDFGLGTKGSRSAFISPESEASAL
jgi:hypothetical protein